MKNKKYNRDRKGRFTRASRKIIILFLFLAVLFGGYYNWAMQSPEYVHAEIKVNRQTADNRTIEEHVWAIMDEYGLTLDEKIKAVSIINCESRWNPYAVGDNSKSFGLWQIHEGYHPEVGRACSFDVYCSTRWALEKYQKDGSFKAWSCNK